MCVSAPEVAVCVPLLFVCVPELLVRVPVRLPQPDLVSAVVDLVVLLLGLLLEVLDLLLEVLDLLLEVLDLLLEVVVSQSSSGSFASSGRGLWLGWGGAVGRMVGSDSGGDGLVRGGGLTPGLHTRPLPVKPALQVHSKLPGVLVQRASLWQLSLPSAHSLISVCM